MQISNFEFKARTADLAGLEAKLIAFDPYFAGEDHQVDTYFNVPHGRLKLREGNIENALIHYERSDIANAKESKILLYRHRPEPELKDVLSTALGVKIVVDKLRKIYFIDNVKIHLDSLSALGTFVEVEAIDEDGSIGIPTLELRCRRFVDLFQIADDDFVPDSYSDLVLSLGR